MCSGATSAGSAFVRRVTSILGDGGIVQPAVKRLADVLGQLA